MFSQIVRADHLLMFLCFFVFFLHKTGEVIGGIIYPGVMTYSSFNTPAYQLNSIAFLFFSVTAHILCW